MELRDLRTFVAVIDEQGIRAAATSLGVDPATVSRSVTRLERSVGASLLSRNPAGTGITAAGKLLLGEARAALLHADRGALLARHASAPTNKAGTRPIVVGFPPLPAVPGVADVLAGVRRAAGSRSFVLRRLSWRDDYSGGPVHTGRVDVAITVLPGSADGLTNVPVRQVPRVVALSLGHALNQTRIVTTRQLDGMKAVAPRALSGEALNYWTLNPQSDGTPRRLARRPKSVSDLLSYIADGIGFLTAPAFVPLMWQRSDLAYRRVDAPPCWIGLVWNPDLLDQRLQERLITTGTHQISTQDATTSPVRH